MPFWIAARDTGTALGRGVFATRAFDEGDLVEICPVVLIEDELGSIPEPIRRLIFNWPQGRYALALGYGSIYNHADDPNLEFNRDVEDLAIRFNALRTIEIGEQLTINYNQVSGEKDDSKKDWFSANLIDKLDPNEGIEQPGRGS